MSTKSDLSSIIGQIPDFSGSLPTLSPSKPTDKTIVADESSLVIHQVWRDGFRTALVSFYKGPFITPFLDHVNRIRGLNGTVTVTRANGQSFQVGPGEEIGLKDPKIERFGVLSSGFCQFSIFSLPPADEKNRPLVVGPIVPPNPDPGPVSLRV